VGVAWLGLMPELLPRWPVFANCAPDRTQSAIHAGWEAVAVAKHLCPHFLARFQLCDRLLLDMRRKSSLSARSGLDCLSVELYCMKA
jgi:hypothetical protein